MLIPQRCFTCGKVLSDKWEEYAERTDDGEHPKDIMDDLGVERYCCRTVMLTQVDLLDDIAAFKKE